MRRQVRQIDVSDELVENQLFAEQTPGGLRLAWPLQRRYAIPLCRTGSPGEVLVVAGLVVWIGATALRLHLGVGL